MANRFFEGAAHAALYAKFRPTPPLSLVKSITMYLQKEYSGPMSVAIDVGCGSGQSTQILSPFFSSVIGLDISEAQITEAIKKNTNFNVSYKVSMAEKLPFSDSSLQLVTAGQACHWFNLPLFYKEVDRILAPGGVLALYGYNFPKPMFEDKTDALFKIIDDVYVKDTGGYWGKRREDVDAAYSHKKYIIPYTGFLRDDDHYVDQKGSISDLKGYLSTWSGWQNYRLKHGDDAALDMLNKFEKRMMDALDVNTSPEETEVVLRFKYFLLMGRKPCS